MPVKHSTYAYLALNNLLMQGKVKAIADAVWARLSGSFSKDVLHAQHVYVFAQILRAGKASKGARVSV